MDVGSSVIVGILKEWPPKNISPHFIVVVGYFWSFKVADSQLLKTGFHRVVILMETGVNGIVEAAKLVRGDSVNQPKKEINNVLVTSGVGVPTGGALLGLE